VFARDGLTGATTRAISREAGVNEVTLFRLFETKEGLIEAVVRQNFGPELWRAAREGVAPSGDLRADLVTHAGLYERVLQENLPLIRAMIGEIHHHGENERQVFQGIFRPLRAALEERLRLAQEAGELRRDVSAMILADLFAGMIFTGVLRRASKHSRREYPNSDYLDAAVDLLLRGAGQ